MAKCGCELEPEKVIQSRLLVMLLAINASMFLTEALTGWLAQSKSPLMIGIGLLALCANLSCMALLQKYRHGEVHIRASWVFTKNDALANLG